MASGPRVLASKVPKGLKEKLARKVFLVLKVLVREARRVKKVSEASVERKVKRASAVQMVHRAQ